MLFEWVAELREEHVAESGSNSAGGSVPKDHSLVWGNGEKDFNMWTQSLRWGLGEQKVQ